MYYVDKSEIDRSLGTGLSVFNYMMFVNDRYLSRLDSKNSLKCKEKANKYGCPVLYISNDRDYNWLKNMKWIDEYKSQSKEAVTTEVKKLGFTKVIKDTNWTHPFRFFQRKRKLSSVVPMDEDIVCKETDMMIDPQVNGWKLPGMTQRKRVAIPASMRGIVWRNYFSTIDHECSLCSNIISLDNFECGHIISVANGGVNHPMNLLPLCGKCNKSMSSMNMNDYCDAYGVQLKVQPLSLKNISVI
jgi:hypothetical protein